MSSLRPEDRETIKQITVAGVRAGLEQFISSQSRRGITLAHMTVGSDALRELSDTLASESTQMRLDGLLAAHVDNPYQAHLWVLTSQILKFGESDKANAREDAIALALFLDAFKPETEQMIEPEIPKSTLTRDKLDKAMRQTLFPEPGSVAEQLDDQLCLIGDKGLIMIPVRKQGDDPDKGTSLPTDLLDILESLRHIESETVLKEWILEKFSSDEIDDCVGLLRAVVDMAVFVDDRSFVSLYAAGKKELPLLPFLALHRAIIESYELLKGTPGFEPYTKKLEKLKQLVEFRFSQVTRGSLKDTINIATTTRLSPSQDEVALAFADWAKSCAIKHGLKTPRAAYQAMKLLEQLGVTDAREFVETLKEISGNDTPLVRDVYYEAVMAGMIPGETRKAFIEARRLLEANPIFDAADIDWAKKIPNETELLEIYYGPGTYDLATKGHLDFSDRVIAYISYLNQHNETGNVFRIFLISPILHPNVPNYSKRPASIYERVGSLMLATAGRDLYITTKLQPLPDRAGNLFVSIRTLQANFLERVRHCFDAADRLVSFDTRVIPCMGSDELGWQNVEERKILPSVLPRKLQIPSVVVGRSGDFLDLLRSVDSITRFTQANLVMTPGTPRTSSTENINKLHSGDTFGIPPAVVPFALEHWSPKRIRDREHRQRVSSVDIPSATQIYEQLMREISRL